MPTGYRDDLPAAAALLERLDEAHARRVVDARRSALEIERACVTGQYRHDVLSVVFFGGVIVAFLAFRYRVLHPFDHRDGSLALMVLGLLLAAGSGGWGAWQKHLRLVELSRIDAEIEDLATPSVRIAPETLAAAHLRIAEREIEEEAIAGVQATSPPNTP